MCPTQKFSHSLYSFSPALLKAERKPSGERAAARFACGDAESLAAPAAVHFMIVGGAMTAHTKFTRHINVIILRQFHHMLVTLLSREIPRWVLLEFDTLGTIMYSWCYGLV